MKATVTSAMLPQLDSTGAWVTRMLRSSTDVDVVYADRTLATMRRSGGPWRCGDRRHAGGTGHRGGTLRHCRDFDRSRRRPVRRACRGPCQALFGEKLWLLACRRKHEDFGIAVPAVYLVTGRLFTRLGDVATGG
jgi:hypothetical protein